jgi:hypothetical protein
VKGVNFENKMDSKNYFIDFLYDLPDGRAGHGPDA